MAEITGRRRGELVRGVFEVLMDKLDGLPAAQVLKAVEQTVPPSEFERESLPTQSGGAPLREDNPLRHDYLALDG